MSIYVKLAEFTSIESSRLLLRPFRLEDAQEMFAYSGNPENMKFVFGAHLSVEEVREFIANHFMKNPLGKWAIELKSEHKMIGSIHFVKLSEKKRTAEIGYVLNKAYWNQGLLTEALQLLTEFSFEQFGLKTVDLLIDEENSASQKVAQKVGYQQVKKFKAAHQYSGSIRNFEKYERRKADFLTSTKNRFNGEI